ncbi:hypothetical protein, partial [Escherichia coli]|uniref:hypothetical protein n=1 Tax=Escherichia coli TaxID=562 RepID=UPI0019D5FE96
IEPHENAPYTTATQALSRVEAMIATIPPKQHYRHQLARDGRQPALFLSSIPRTGDAQCARRPVQRGGLLISTES